MPRKPKADPDETLHTIIAAHGFNLEQAATKAGLARKSVSRWANGHHQPQALKAAKLAKILVKKNANPQPMLIRILAACRRAAASRESSPEASHGGA